MTPVSADQVIRSLRLKPHPEGGYYREVHRSSSAIGTPPGYPDVRVAMTAILFLLPEGGFSAFHRVRSEEAWVHLEGAPIELVILGDVPLVHRLAPASAGGLPLAVVPPGSLQGTRPIGGWALATCFVAPGFEFADFEMPPRAVLLERFPAHQELVRCFTR